jgi:hypothetical protein
MPFTLFAHQAFVLPLKWARPRWFDGTALCLGSMAPDWAYAFEGTRLAFRSHTLPSLLWWSLPVTLAATWLLRHVVALPLGRGLPGRFGREVAALARARRSFVRTTTSAVLGAGSHVFVDGFTHPGGWATARVDLLRHWVRIAGHPLQVAKILQYTGHVLGSAVGALLLLAILRAGKLEAWSREEPAPAGPVHQAPMVGPQMARLWAPILVGVCVAVFAAASALLTGGGIPAAAMRSTWVIAGGVLAGAVLARRAG